MTEIKIIKSIADRRIGTYVYEGQSLLDGLTYDNLGKSKAAYDRWTSSVAHDLDTWFSDKTLLQEFREGSVIPLDENDSHADEKRRFAETLGRQLEWLSTLARRIPDFPQAHNTPQVLRG
jgi:hypothetical protein